MHIYIKYWSTLISPVYTYHVNRVKFVASQARAAISTVRECLHLALVRCNCTGQSTRRLVKCACALSVNVATVTMEPSSMILLFRCISVRHRRHLAPSRRQQNALLRSRRVESFRARQVRHRQLFLMLLSAALIVSSQVDRRI